MIPKELVASNAACPAGESRLITVLRSPAWADGSGRRAGDPPPRVFATPVSRTIAQRVIDRFSPAGRSRIKARAALAMPPVPVPLSIARIVAPSSLIAPSVRLQGSAKISPSIESIVRGCRKVCVLRRSAGLNGRGDSPGFTL
jgi:hypothetical protein